MGYEENWNSGGSLPKIIIGGKVVILVELHCYVEGSWKLFKRSWAECGRESTINCHMQTSMKEYALVTSID